MPILAERRFQLQPEQSWGDRSLPRNRSGFSIDESRRQAQYGYDVWYASERPEVQFTEDDWNFVYILRENIQAWRRLDYNDIRSYSFPVSESFKIAAREYPAIKVDPNIMGGAPCVAHENPRVYDS